MKKNLKLRYKKDKERKRDMGDRAETRDGLAPFCTPRLIKRDHQEQ